MFVKKSACSDFLWSAAKVSKDNENISVNQEKRPVRRLVELTRHYDGSRRKEAGYSHLNLEAG